MDKSVFTYEIRRNLPLLTALLSIWNHNFLGYPTYALIPYSQALARFPAHIQQVEMESNGKRISRDGEPMDFQTGPIIWGEPGTNAQHSFFQWLHQGTSIAPLEFIGFERSQYEADFEFQGTTSQEKLLSNLFAQALALAVGEKNENPDKVFPGNRPSHILLGERLTPFVLGSLLALFEHKVVFEGFIWGINSFDQEGVQLGKTLANRFLKYFSGKQKFPLGEAFIKYLK
jgi:glucose-6-phosphate isomerase